MAWVWKEEEEAVAEVVTLVWYLLGGVVRSVRVTTEKFGNSGQLFRCQKRAEEK